MVKVIWFWKTYSESVLKKQGGMTWYAKQVAQFHTCVHKSHVCTQTRSLVGSVLDVTTFRTSTYLLGEVTSSDLAAGQ